MHSLSLAPRGHRKIHWHAQVVVSHLQLDLINAVVARTRGEHRERAEGGEQELPLFVDKADVDEVDVQTLPLRVEMERPQHLPKNE